MDVAGFRAAAHDYHGQAMAAPINVSDLPKIWAISILRLRTQDSGTSNLIAHHLDPNYIVPFV